MVVVKYWCKRCKQFHDEKTLIGIEHIRYMSTKQKTLEVK